jgi:hypothetical protein
MSFFKHEAFLDALDSKKFEKPVLSGYSFSDRTNILNMIDQCSVMTIVKLFNEEVKAADLKYMIALSTQQEESRLEMNDEMLKSLGEPILFKLQMVEDETLLLAKEVEVKLNLVHVPW